MFGRGRNRAVHSPLGSTARPPLFSPIANYWSDMRFVDELQVTGRRVWVCKRH